MVENLDHHIGRIIDRLKERGVYDNTLIVFMADNGAAGSEDFYQTGPFVEYLQARYDNSYEDMGRPDSWVSYGRGWAKAGAAPWSVNGSGSRCRGRSGPGWIRYEVCIDDRRRKRRTAIVRSRCWRTARPAVGDAVGAAVEFMPRTSRVMTRIISVIVLLLLVASPSAAQRDEPEKDALTAVIQSFVTTHQRHEIEVLVLDSHPAVAAAARDIGVRTNTLAAAIQCEGDDRRYCRLPTADMLISFDDLKVADDSASVIVGLAFGDREEFRELYMQIWYVQLVRRGHDWQVAERRLDIET